MSRLEDELRAMAVEVVAEMGIRFSDEEMAMLLSPTPDELHTYVHRAISRVVQHRNAQQEVLKRRAQIRLVDGGRP